MATKIKNLEMHVRSYRVQFWRGKTRHVIPLNTADLGEALKLRDQIMNGDDLIAEALAMRAAGRRAWHLMDRVSGLTATHGVELATAYAETLEGFITPWTALPIEAWHTEGNRKTGQPHSQRTRDDAKTVLSDLKAFLRTKNLPLVIESFSPEVAAQWKMEMQAAGVHVKTLKKKLSMAHSLWAFALRNKIIKLSENPFKGLSPPVPDVPDSEREQPILDMAPVLKQWPETDSMGQCTRIMALSGMRPEEVALLKVEDCKDEWFNIRKSKTPAGVRRVPIHSLLKPMIATLTSGRDSSEFLIERGGVGKRGRATVFTKAFTYAVDKMGIANRMEGKRRGLINLYSIKRRAVAILEWSDVPESTVARVLGHKRAGFNSFAQYNPMGPETTQLRQAVELLHLNKIVPPE